MQAIISIWLFTLCINLGIYFVGNAAGVGTLINAAIPPEELEGQLENQSASIGAASGGFNPLLVFGDYTKALDFLEGLFAGGWLVRIIENLCFQCDNLIYFTAPLQGILLLLNVVGIMGFLRGINIL